ncbi:uncharacterized protein BDZ99DRAFT_453470 [Mytilinidion resinicola]|uniref:Amino acid permease/ SLC12A domain-containing protein n=1 Tax=Mytilinidion resinicola TaxID=574789 RepID=A0A6A6Y4T9_9PEZI|nr:uncharacterized protein BDZ99DRAFT_453470 [Mytilinidion resinicola]KAF2803245.1 hypothetical protein BDZ99DRAFT_453470 [Mytilinidion resinicola]
MADTPMQNEHSRSSIELSVRGKSGSVVQSGVNEADVDSEHSNDGWFDNVAQWIFHNDHLDRVLEKHHITSIAISGTIGIGLFITSGELIAVSGSAGCVLGYAIASLIVVGVYRCLAELVSVRPLSGALIDYPHTFVDPALGFAVAVTYCLAQCLSMAALTSGAARVADNFGPSGSPPLDKGKKTGIVIGLVTLTLFSNICGVKTYGRIERIVKWFKILLILLLCILMIVINLGVGGARMKPTVGNYSSEYAFTPYFNPAGFNDTTAHTPPTGNTEGIPGGGGRFLAVWTSVTVGMFACMGGDIVVVTAGEARRPRKDLPTATRFMYWVPLGLYFITSLLVGFNINYTDRDLFRMYSLENTNTSHSPFIIVVKSTAIKALPDVLNACFLVSGYTAANTALYVSSRTLFATAQLYGNTFIKSTLGRTNNGHTPIAAIVFCSSFGFLALLGLADTSYNQPILTLSAFFTGAVACVYASQCIAFLRFKAGLDLLHERQVYSRDRPPYTTKHYRAHWQPWWAYVGLIGSCLIVFFSGWPAIYILNSRHHLTADKQLKTNVQLAADLIGAYAGPLVFLTLYLGWKFWHGTTVRPITALGVPVYVLQETFPGDEEPDASGRLPDAENLRRRGAARGVPGQPGPYAQREPTVQRMKWWLREAWGLMK